MEGEKGGHRLVQLKQGGHPSWQVRRNCKELVLVSMLSINREKKTKGSME